MLYVLYIYIYIYIHIHLYLHTYSGRGGGRAGDAPARDQVAERAPQDAVDRTSLSRRLVSFLHSLVNACISNGIILK